MSVQTKRPWWLWSKPSDAWFTLVMTAAPVTTILTRDRPFRLVDGLLVALVVVSVVLTTANLVAFKRHPEWITDGIQPFTGRQMRWYGALVGMTAAAAVAILVYSVVAADSSLVWLVMVLFVASFVLGLTVRRHRPRAS